MKRNFSGLKANKSINLFKSKVEQMKKYRRTASKEQISMISERLYNEGRTHRVKSVSNLRLRNSYMSNLNSTYSDMRKKSKQSSPYKKKNYFKKYSFQSASPPQFSVLPAAMTQFFIISEPKFRLKTA